MSKREAERLSANLTDEEKAAMEESKARKVPATPSKHANSGKRKKARPKAPLPDEEQAALEESKASGDPVEEHKHANPEKREEARSGAPSPPDWSGGGWYPRARSVPVELLATANPLRTEYEVYNGGDSAAPVYPEHSTLSPGAPEFEPGELWRGADEMRKTEGSNTFDTGIPGAGSGGTRASKRLRKKHRLGKEEAEINEENEEEDVNINDENVKIKKEGEVKGKKEPL
jgi:hypothetical protein